MTEESARYSVSERVCLPERDGLAGMVLAGMLSARHWKATQEPVQTPRAMLGTNRQGEG